MKFNKLLAMGLIALSGLTTLTACSLGKSAPAAVSVTSQNVVVSKSQTANDGMVYLDVNIAVKNTSNQSLGNISSSAFSLYDSKGNKVAAQYISSSNSNSSDTQINASSLEAGKTVKGDLVFQVTKGDKYTLHYTPMTSDYKKQSDVTTTVDTSKATDNSMSLKKMAGNFVDAVFLGKSGISSDLKNNLNDQQKTFQSDFKTALTNDLNGRVSGYAPSTSDVSNIVTSYLKANQSKASVNYSVIEMFPTYAVIGVSPKVIDFNNIDITDIMTKWENANMGNYDDYNKAEIDAAKYLVSQLPGKISSTAPTSPSGMDSKGYQLILTKGTDGKWSVKTTDDSDNYDYKSLQSAMSGGEMSSY